ncbi:hypothetical protein SGRA_4044 [Saprospira grandis str. Lewin]|uniref:Uncharacterized protein n=1 Tax=Saprospira grandis (strain Lewin) TaxID=984262 RepID=H6L8N4_SAPGL|nr:hypothetical protein SGRA_4044 [Saprospira grandis str. Lewin]
MSQIWLAKTIKPQKASAAANKKKTKIYQAQENAEKWPSNKPKEPKETKPSKST